MGSVGGTGKEQKCLNVGVWEGATIKYKILFNKTRKLYIGRYFEINK